MRLPRGITATVPKGMATKHFQRAALAAPRLLLRNGTFQFHGSETFPRYSTTAQPTARHQIKPILPLQAQNTCASASLPACSSETGLSHFQVKYKNPAQSTGLLQRTSLLQSLHSFCRSEALSSQAFKQGVSVPAPPQIVIHAGSWLTCWDREECAKAIPEQQPLHSWRVFLSVLFMCRFLQRWEKPLSSH